MSPVVYTAVCALFYIQGCDGQILGTIQDIVLPKGKVECKSCGIEPLTTFVAVPSLLPYCVADFNRNFLERYFEGLSNLFEVTNVEGCEFCLKASGTFAPTPLINGVLLKTGLPSIPNVEVRTCYSGAAAKLIANAIDGKTYCMKTLPVALRLPLGLIFDPSTKITLCKTNHCNA